MPCGLWLASRRLPGEGCPPKLYEAKGLAQRKSLTRTTYKVRDLHRTYCAELPPEPPRCRQFLPGKVDEVYACPAGAREGFIALGHFATVKR